MKQRHAWPSGIMMAAGLVVPGCGDGLARQPVSGEIFVDGKPLTEGWIEFMPLVPSTPTSAASQVYGGQFRVARAQGLVPATYVVRITAAAASKVYPLNELPSGIIPPPKEPIPARYNNESTLSTEITADRPNTYRYEIVTQSKAGVR